MATPPDFTAGQILTAAQMNAVSMWKITETAFTNESVVLVAGCFTGDYRHYKIVWSINNTVNATAVLRGRLLTGGSVIDTNYEASTRDFSPGANVNTFGSNTTITNGFALGYTGDPAGIGVTGEATIFNPNIAVRTTYIADTFGLQPGTSFWRSVCGGFHNLATAYDGISFSASANNITGTITVYGYN
jgi:hypothetical protein